MDELNREELAWAGGLFVGEGCISLLRHRRSPWQPTIIIEMTDYPPLERFQEAIGGLGTIRGPYLSPSRPLNSKPAWRWCAQTWPEAQAVLAMIWPWLCPRRKARAAEVMDLALAWNFPEAA